MINKITQKQKGYKRTFRGCLVLLDRANYSWLLRALSSWVLNSSRDGDCTTGLKRLLQSHTMKKIFL